jgi:hypothetical protein
MNIFNDYTILHRSIVAQKAVISFLDFFTREVLHYVCENFCHPFYFGPGSKSGTGIHSGSGSAKANSLRSDRIRIYNSTKSNSYNPGWSTDSFQSGTDNSEPGSDDCGP